MSKQRLALVVCVIAVLSAGCLGLGGSDDPAENVSNGEPQGQAPEDDDLNGNGPDDGDDELPDAETILTELDESGFEFESLQGVMQLEIEADGERLSGTYDVWERPADELRVEVVDKYFAAEADLYVSDDEETWWYSEHKNRYAQGEFGGFIGFQGGMALLSDITEETDVTVEGTETVLDRDTFVLTSTQDTGDDGLINSIGGTIFLDQETRYPLKVEQEVTSETVNQTVTATFTEVTFNPDLEDDLFEFDIPEGAQLFTDIEDPTFDTVAAANEQVPFDVVEPEAPANTTIDEVRVFETLSETRLTILYEEVTVDDREPGIAATVSVTDNPGQPVLAGETALLNH